MALPRHSWQAFNIINMTRKSFLFPPFAAALLLGISFSCSKSGGSGSGNGNGTGPTTAKDSILANIGNHIILPAYAMLNASVNSLDSAIADFNAGPSGTKLSAVRGL